MGYEIFKRFGFYKKDDFKIATVSPNVQQEARSIDNRAGGRSTNLTLLHSLKDKYTYPKRCGAIQEELD